MKKKIVCASIAIATMCLAPFFWWLSGNEFERGSELANFVGLCLLTSFCVYFLAYICPLWDDDENDHT